MMKGYQNSAMYHPFLETLSEIGNDWGVTGGTSDNSEVNFILCGQSNSVGRIETTSSTFPTDLPVNGVIANSNYFDDDDTWKGYTTFMNYATDHSGDAGVEYRVAKHFSDLGKTVNLLKYGEGGQAVTGGCWAENAFCTTGLIDAINASGKEFNFMIWIQGESDSVDSTKAAAYYSAAKLTHERIRRETGQNYKIVFCRIALPPETTGLPYMAEVNTSLQNLGNDMPNSVFANVPTVDNSTDIEYNQHYNGRGLDIIANEVLTVL